MSTETPHQEITRRWDETYSILDNAGQSSARHVAEALDECREEAEENQVEGDELRHLLAEEAAELQAWAKTARLRLLGVGFRESDTRAALHEGRGRGPLLALLRRALVCCETKAEPSARALVADIRAALTKEAR